VAAALRYARRLGPGHLVVALGADTGRNYLSKFFDDRWLAENKLTLRRAAGPLGRRPAEARGGRQAGDGQPDTTIERGDPADGGDGISQLPVMDDGKPVGQRAGVDPGPRPARRQATRQGPVGEIMARPLPTLDVHTVHLDEAYRLLLAGYTGVLATRTEGGGHHHAHRPDPLLGPDAGALLADGRERLGLGAGRHLDHQ
jgi:cystathionine beta-synthase